MPVSQADAQKQIQRLRSLPYVSGDEEIWRELRVTAAQHAIDEGVLERAISALLQDTGRASNADTNRVPSPGELIAWIQAEQKPVAERDSGWSCGKLVPGWQYLDYPVEGISYEKVWHQSKCERGWIRKTEMHDSGYVDGHGNPIMQPYEFSARCRCVGGTL